MLFYTAKAMNTQGPNDHRNMRISDSGLKAHSKAHSKFQLSGGGGVGGCHCHSCHVRPLQ